MTKSEIETRSRYRSKNVKQFVICFYPTDADLIDMVRAKIGKDSMTKYIKNLIKKDLGIEQ